MLHIVYMDADLLWADVCIYDMIQYGQKKIKHGIFIEVAFKVGEEGE